MKEQFEFNWHEKFNTGYFVVDSQHKKLFALLSEFANAYVNGYDKELVSTILFELEEYALLHFKEEEQLFKLQNLKISTEHSQQHKEFIDTIRDLKFDYVSEDKEISSELFEYLYQWLKGHILGIDNAELHK